MQNTMTASLSSRLARGAGQAVLGDLISRGLLMLNGVLIARWLGKELFGEYTVIATALTFLASFLGFGMDTWLLREGGREPSKLRQNAAGVVIFKVFIIAVLCVAALVARTAWVSLTFAFGLATLGMVAGSFSQTGYTVLRARRQNGRVALIQVVVAALVLAGLVLISASRPTVIGAIAIQTAVGVAAALVLAQQVWHFLITKHQPDTPEEAREERVRLRDLGKVIRRLPLILFAALPFIGADLLASFYTQSSPAILGSVNQTALAQYKIAFTLATAPYVIPTMVFMVALPFLSDTKTEPREYASAVRAMAFSALAYGLILLVAIPLAAPLITVIYGPDYAEAVPLLRMMSAMPLLKSFSFLSVAVMLSRNRQRLRVALQVGVVFLSVIGGLIIIPRFNAVGAAGLAVVVEIALCAAYGLGAYVAWRGKP